MKRLSLVAACVLLTAPAWAEKADANKEIIILSDSWHVNDLSQERELIGNVRMERGTLLVKADRALVKEDPQGYQFITLFADGGKKATFRQKMDGGDNRWTEGEAERIEYDDKSETVKFFANVKLRQLDGTRVHVESTGNFFSYSSRTEAFNMLNDASGTTKQGGQQVRTVIQPRVIKPAEKK